jgi:hypothetical protein
LSIPVYAQPDLELGVDNDLRIGVGSGKGIRLEDLVFNRPCRIERHANTDGLAIDGVRISHPITDGRHLPAIGPKSQTCIGGRFEDPVRRTEIFSPELACTVRNVKV